MCILCVKEQDFLQFAASQAIKQQSNWKSAKVNTCISSFYRQVIHYQLFIMFSCICINLKYFKEFSFCLQNQNKGTALSPDV